MWIIESKDVERKNIAGFWTRHLCLEKTLNTGWPAGTFVWGTRLPAFVFVVLNLLVNDGCRHSSEESEIRKWKCAGKTSASLVIRRQVRSFFVVVHGMAFGLHAKTWPYALAVHPLFNYTPQHVGLHSVVLPFRVSLVPCHACRQQWLNRPVTFFH